MFFDYPGSSLALAPHSGLSMKSPVEYGKWVNQAVCPNGGRDNEECINWNFLFYRCCFSLHT